MTEMRFDKFSKSQSKHMESFVNDCLLDGWEYIETIVVLGELIVVMKREKRA